MSKYKYSKVMFKITKTDICQQNSIQTPVETRLFILHNCFPYIPSSVDFV